MNREYEIGLMLLLAASFFFFGFEKIILLEPRGIHFIRQTDSLSFVAQYYNWGYDFFNPRLFNLESIEGRAACEFPILYYLTALLYSVIGEKVYLLKILNLMIAYLGIYGVFKMAFYILKDHIYALLIAFFLMTSTVFNHYSLNYLPDPAALGFIFMGWYFYFKFDSNGSKKAIVWSSFFFTLGGLIKVTYFISPLAILVFYLLTISVKKVQMTQPIKALLIGLFSGALVVIGWNAYAISYNSIYNSHYFTTGARPLWSLSSENIEAIWGYMSNYWYNKYFTQSSFHFLFIAVLIQIVLFRKANYRIATTTLILFLGSLSYFLLFYVQFADHDYYFLGFMPLIVFLLINLILVLQSSLKKRSLHAGIKLVMAIVVLVGINYSKMKLENRNRHIEAFDDFSRIGFVIQNEIKKIEDLGIPTNAKVIVAPDLSKNGGLFFLNRMGWKIDRTEEISVERIISYTNLGAEFLILATNEESAFYAGKATGKLIYKGNDLHVFKLKN